MKTSTTLFIFMLLTLAFQSCDTQQSNTLEKLKDYVPQDIDLYNEIVAMDKVYFDAYNSCDLVMQDSMYSDDIEFFHDKGGLMTSKTKLLKALENNICGKVRRELVQGSIEVYPIFEYGAVQIGYHKFYNNQEPEAESNPSKFITVWKDFNGQWKMEKVFSFH